MNDNYESNENNENNDGNEKDGVMIRIHLCILLAEPSCLFYEDRNSCE